MAGGAAVLAWRVHETRAPVTAARILLPPLGMSTGFLMFVLPSMRIPWAWALAAFAAGALLLAWPLARSSSLERVDDEISLQRSSGFFLILLGLFALRLALHEYIGEALPPRVTRSPGDPQATPPPAGPAAPPPR